MDDVLAEDTRMRFGAPIGRAVYGMGAEPPPGRDLAELHRQTIAVALEDARRALAARDFPSVEEAVRHLLAENRLPESAHNAPAYGVLDAHVRLFEELQRRTLGQSPVALFTEALPAETAPQPSRPPAPLFSELLPKYIDVAVKDKGWRGQSKAQNEATFAMFKEVCGDRPVNAYTRAILSDFYNTLRALPALYSKDKRWRALPLRDVVEAAKDDPAERLTMKTLKRHFSALGGFFTYAKRHGHIEGENPAYGFEFPSKGRANSKRKMWEGETLRNLFKSPVWTGCHPYYRTRAGTEIIRDDKFWLPLLGLYHGNRLEEFAQLRREDVKQEDGIWFLDIHGEGGRQIKNDQ
jgi:hypothetical protein